jgi:hypothetical protein
MAATATIHETVEYRAVIVEPRSRGVLGLATVQGYRLPRVLIPRWVRPAQQLRETIRTSWSLNTLILEFITEDDCSSPCVVAELLAPTGHSNLNEIPLDKISSPDLSEGERFALMSLLNGESASPFSRIGWIDTATAWVETATGRKISSKSDVDQLNAGGAFTLLRFRTEHCMDYWMKATGEPNAHELSITSLLSRLCGDYLPQFVASRPEWNAWLMSGSGVPISEMPTDSVMLFNLLEDAVKSMADFQLRSMGREQDLLNAGAFDQRMSALLAHSDALFTYLEECMQLQTSGKAPRITKTRLQELKLVFERVCERMDALGIPNAVVHGDMSLANILRGNEHCQFIDWCETYVGNPLITLQHILLLNQLTNPELKEFIDHQLMARYRSAISKACSEEAISEGLIYMPLVAATSALYGRGDWLTTSRREEPHRRVYARTLARHMERAAGSPTLLGALGL